jgi:hypothetical protein
LLYENMHSDNIKFYSYIPLFRRLHAIMLLNNTGIIILSDIRLFDSPWASLVTQFNQLNLVCLESLSWLVWLPVVVGFPFGKSHGLAIAKENGVYLYRAVWNARHVPANRMRKIRSPWRPGKDDIFLGRNYINNLEF